MKLQRIEEKIENGYSEYGEDAKYEILQPQESIIDSDDESDLPDYMYEREDYALEVTLSTGVVVVLRDMTADDISHLNKIRKGVPHPTIKGRMVQLDEVELLKRIICHLCIQWGDQTSVTPPEIGKIRAKDLARLSKALEMFQRV